MIHINTIKALPLVASMLGNRLGVNVNIGNTQNACTDGKTIYLPQLPADADERLYCLVNGFIDHESAHIRFTDFQVLDNANMSPLEKHIWNSIEDWRIESVFGNFSFYSYKKACGQKKTVRGSKNSRRLSNGTPAI